MLRLDCISINHKGRSLITITKSHYWRGVACFKINAEKEFCWKKVHTALKTKLLKYSQFFLSPQSTQG